MKQILLAIFLLSLITVTANAQDENPNLTDDAVQVVAYWEVGGTYTYDFIQRSANTKKGVRTAAATFATVRVDVLEATETSYLLEWAFSNCRDSNHRHNTTPLMDQLPAKADGLKLKLRTDELGAVTAYENTDEVLAFFGERIKDLRSDFIDQGGKKNPMLVALDLFKETLHRASAMQVVAPYIENYLSLYGAAYPRGETIEAEIELPNPFGGAPIPGDLTFKIDRVDAKTEEAVFLMTNTADPEDLMRMIAGRITAQIESESEREELEEQMAKTEFTESYRHVFDTRRGVMNYMRHTRVIRLTDRERIATTVIKLKTK